MVYLYIKIHKYICTHIYVYISKKHQVYEIKVGPVHLSRVLIPVRQDGDILYQYVTAHISSSPHPPSFPQRNKLLSVASGRTPVLRTPVGRQSWQSSFYELRIRYSGCVTKQVPPFGTSKEFFQMFLFITFVTSEYIGRVRRLVE